MLRGIRPLLLVPIASLASALYAQSWSVTTIAGSSDATGYVNGPGPSARFNYPEYIAVDRAGNAYVADSINNAIRKIDPSGNVTTLAGPPPTGIDTPPPAPGYADGPGAAALFSAPRGIAVTPSGTVYVADSNNEVIRKIDPDGTVSTLAGAPGVAGSLDGLGGSARFSSPRKLVLDSGGNLYVLGDTDHRLRKITPDGVVTTIAGSNGTPLTLSSDGFTIDPSGNIFAVAPSGQQAVLQEFEASGPTVTIGGATGFLDGSGGAAGFLSPRDLAPDRSGNIFVNDWGTIREVSVDGQVTTLMGQVGSLQTAVDGIGGAARLSSSATLAADPAGNIFVCDTDNSCIRLCKPTAAPSPPILLYAEKTTYVVAGASVTLSVTAAGTGPFTFQWGKTGTLSEAPVPIAGATSNSRILSDVTAADAGNYWMTVANAAGSYTAMVGFLSVFTPPTTSFSTVHSDPGGPELTSIAYGAEHLVTVGTSGTILVSPNGTAWTNVSSGESESFTGVCYGGGQFVAVGDGGRILISPDGTAWTQAISPASTGRLNGIAYSQSVYVAVGDQGTIITSADGFNWTTRTSGVTTALRSVTGIPRGGGVPPDMLACGDGGKAVESYDFGKTWTAVTQLGLFAGNFEAVAHLADSSSAMALASDGSLAQEAFYTDGHGIPNHWTTWPPVLMPATPRAVIGDAGVIYVFGDGGGIVSEAIGAVASPWATLPSGTHANLEAGCLVGNTVYAVGADETILQSIRPASDRLLNTSGMAITGNGPAVLTAGFVVAGNAPKKLLIRGAGPALAAFGVQGAISHPSLTVLDSRGVTVDSNAGWDSQPNATVIATVGAQVGAFAFGSGSADSAVLTTLNPGAYTVQLGGAGVGGQGLVEIYDADDLASGSSAIVNISARAQVGPNQSITVGLVLGGTASRRMLIRGIGPGLASYGVANALPHPTLTLFNPLGVSSSLVGAWGTQSDPDELTADAALAGAFPLAAGSQDATFVVRLDPGTWTIQLGSGDGSSGVTLLEVYDLP